MDKTPTNEPNRNMDELLTLQEIARLLRVSERTVMRMTESGDIPGGKIAGQWRFSREAVEAWLTERVRSRPTENLVEVVATQKEGLLRLTELLPPERVVMDLRPGEKEDILRQLVDPLREGQMLNDPDRYLDLLIAREEMLSTAVGDGVALPHARDPESAGLRGTCLVLGISRAGIDFNSLDSAPTHLFILVGSPTVSIHLRLLAQVTLMLRTPGVADGLIKAVTGEDVQHLLRKAQTDLSIRL